jgi:integrase
MSLWKGNFKKGGYTSGEKALTPAEYQKLLSVIPNIEHELLIRLAVAGGFRREDIVNINIADIDFNENKIKFYEHKKDIIREVYVPDSIILLIKKVLATKKKGEKKLFSFSGRTAYNIFQRYCKIAGIPPRPFHALRATCIKFCQLAGWTAEQTAKHVGDRISTIQQHYTTPSSDEMRELVKTKGGFA